MPDIPDQTSTVTAVRERYPTPLGTLHANCLLEIARTIGRGAGLLKKDSGTNILLPDGTRVAQDIIMFPDGHAFDCLIGGEAQASPSWQDIGTLDPARYYRVTDTPPVDPPSTGENHPYEGGDNDTGECDHVMADGSICRRPPSDPIHVVTDPPDPDPTDPPPSGVTNAQIYAAIQKLSQHLGVRG